MSAVPGSAFVQDIDAFDDRDGERVEIEGRVRYAAPVDEDRGVASPEDEWPRQADSVVDRPDQQQFPDIRQARHLDIRPVDHGDRARRLCRMCRRQCHDHRDGQPKGSRGSELVKLAERLIPLERPVLINILYVPGLV